MIHSPPARHQHKPVSLVIDPFPDNVDVSYPRHSVEWLGPSTSPSTQPRAASAAANSTGARTPAPQNRADASPVMLGTRRSPLHSEAWNGSPRNAGRPEFTSMASFERRLKLEGVLPLGDTAASAPASRSASRSSRGGPYRDMSPTTKPKGGARPSHSAASRTGASHPITSAERGRTKDSCGSQLGQHTSGKAAHPQAITWQQPRQVSMRHNWLTQSPSAWSGIDFFRAKHPAHRVVPRNLSSRHVAKHVGVFVAPSPAASRAAGRCSGAKPVKRRTASQRAARASSRQPTVRSHKSPSRDRARPCARCNASSARRNHGPQGPHTSETRLHRKRDKQRQHIVDAFGGAERMDAFFRQERQAALLAAQEDPTQANDSTMYLLWGLGGISRFDEVVPRANPHCQPHAQQAGQSPPPSRRHTRHVNTTLRAGSSATPRSREYDEGAATAVGSKGALRTEKRNTTRLGRSRNDSHLPYHQQPAVKELLAGLRQLRTHYKAKTSGAPNTSVEGEPPHGQDVPTTARPASHGSGCSPDASAAARLKRCASAPPRRTVSSSSTSRSASKGWSGDVRPPPLERVHSHGAFVSRMAVEVLTSPGRHRIPAFRLLSPSS